MKRAEREELKRKKELEKQELDRKRAEREEMKRRKGRPAAAAPPLQSTSPPTETSGEPSPSGQASRESPNVQVDTEGMKERTNNTQFTVILREIPDNTPPEEVNEPDCPEERPEG